MKTASDKANIRRTASLLRTVAVLLILVCLCASLCSCQMIGAKFRPGAQKNAQWMSEDGSIFIQSDDSGSTYGYIIVNDEKIPISGSFANWGIASFRCCTKDGDSIGYGYDRWSVSHCRKNSFEIGIQSSVFLNKCDRVRFRRLEDSEKIDYELPSSSSDKDSAAFENTMDKNAALLYPAIDGHTDGADNKSDSYMMAIGILKYGIKEICEPRLMSDCGGLITVEFTDAEGTAYSLTYDIDEHKVVKIGSIG